MINMEMQYFLGVLYEVKCNSVKKNKLYFALRYWCLQQRQLTHFSFFLINVEAYISVFKRLEKEVVGVRNNISLPLEVTLHKCIGQLHTCRAVIKYNELIILMLH